MSDKLQFVVDEPNVQFAINRLRKPSAGTIVRRKLSNRLVQLVEVDSSFLLFRRVVDKLKLVGHLNN